MYTGNNESPWNDCNNCSSAPKNLCQIVFSIAASIADQEDALACILNAECNKINLVLENCGDIDELIAIDSSIQATIGQIASLESVLTAKLDSILPILIECDCM